METNLAPIVPSEDSAGLRKCLGQYATGVTVVTANGPDGPVGITANSFASVSLAPPLVLWSPAKSSRRYDVFAKADVFAIHVLRSDQEAVCHGFAHNWAPFDTLKLGLDQNEDGTPIFDNCLARYECRLQASHDAGDHSIIIGHVTRAAKRMGAPLVFQSGQYGDFLAKG